MPTYEYACTNCEDRLEIVQSIHEETLVDCPVCGNGKLRKIFGNVGVVFKGSGFYRTDSRNDRQGSESKVATSDAKSETKTETKAESKSEAKTESKSESKSETPSVPKSESKSTSKPASPAKAGSGTSAA